MGPYWINLSRYFIYEKLQCKKTHSIIASFQMVDLNCCYYKLHRNVPLFLDLGIYPLLTLKVLNF